MTAREVFDLIQDELEQVEKKIAAESVASVDAVTAVGQYLQSSGGKRLRPSLLLLSAKLAGDGGATAVQLGAVVELIHTATLLHDDVIDGAETRRGRPSTNVKWGNHTCVLAGDWLYMQAFQIALRERRFQILDLLIGLTQIMVEGELLQLERIGRIDVTEADCMELVDRKTARLFSVCARLGALAGHGDAPMQEKLGEYAWNLGMAFQLIDDVLDFTSSEEILGKPTGNDLREGRVTLPLIYLLQRCTQDEAQKVRSVLAEGGFNPLRFSEVLELIDRYDTLRTAREKAQEFAQKAKCALETFPDNPYKDALRSLPDFMLDREF